MLSKTKQFLTVFKTYLWNRKQHNYNRLKKVEASAVSFVISWKFDPDPLKMKMTDTKEKKRGAYIPSISSTVRFQN